MASPRSIAIKREGLLDSIAEAIADAGGPVIDPSRRFRDPAILHNRQLQTILEGVLAIDNDGGLVNDLAVKFPADDFPELHDYLYHYNRRRSLGIRKPPADVAGTVEPVEVPNGVVSG